MAILGGRAKDSVSLVALVAANLIPLGGVLFAGWDASSIVLLYWWENLIVGFYNVLKMALVRVENPAHHLGKLFLIPFFCIHYGGFCGGHGVFLLFLFKLGDGPGAVLPDATWLGPLVFVQTLVHVVVQLWRSAPPELLWALMGLFVSHGISFYQNFIVRGEFLKSSPQKLMGQPYARIVVMHIAIIAGAFLTMALQSPLPLLVVLIGLKIGLDVHLHMKEHELGETE